MPLEKPTEVIIKRSEWLRGEGSGLSYLMCPNGRKCCLGFWALTVGVKDEDIQDVSSPGDLAEDDGIQLKGLVPIDAGNSHAPNTDACENLMIINDDEKITDEERELKLIEEAAKLKVKFIFED